MTHELPRTNAPRLIFHGGLAAVFAIVLAAFAGQARAATDIQVVTSASGIEAWLIQDQTLPIITMQFSFEGGSSTDPIGKEGRAVLLSALFDEGAGDLSSEEFQEALANNSIGFGFNSNRDRFIGTLRTLSDTRDTAFALLALALSEPRFDDEPVERLRAQLVSAARQRAFQPAHIATRLAGDAIFGDHPYGRPSEGTVASLEALTADDARGAYEAIIRRTGLKIAVVGDITAEDLAPLLDDVFATLPETDIPVGTEYIRPRLGDVITHDVETPQTVIRLVNQGIRRDDPDYIPAIVMNYILGGGSFSSRYFQEIREKRGLTYGASSSHVTLDSTSLLISGLLTRTETADEALAVLQDEIRRMAENGPTAAELQAAKDFLIGSYALRFDTSGSIAGQLLGVQVQDLGIDYFQRRNSLIEAVTLEDVSRAAERTLGFGDPTVVLVGTNASAITVNEDKSTE